MKPVLVVNPRSGGGKTGQTFSSMRGTIERALGSVEVRMTERTGHAMALAEEAALSGAPLVVAVGGDGTLNEVVNGLMNAKSQGKESELGLIAQGTGGDFRRSLGLEHRLDAYLEALSRGTTRRIDVGKLLHDGDKERYFVNILSAGMGGLTDRYIATASRAMGGAVAYFGASLKALIGSRPGRVRCAVTRDGVREERVFETLVIAMCNGRYFGSGMIVAPMAEVDDGMMEIIVMGNTSKIGFFLESWRVYDGSHIKDPRNVHLRGQRVELSLENDDAKELFLLDLDGEPLGGLPITVDLVPGALSLRV